MFATWRSPRFPRSSEVDVVVGGSGSADGQLLLVPDLSDGRGEEVSGPAIDPPEIVVGLDTDEEPVIGVDRDRIADEADGAFEVNTSHSSAASPASEKRFELLLGDAQRHERGLSARTPVDDDDLWGLGAVEHSFSSFPMDDHELCVAAGSGPCRHHDGFRRDGLADEARSHV